ncbi:hypothetical protein MTP02_25560 [Streptomyces albus]|nr:hypothetical protein MTP02_25560 [Streptomyces albus]
MVRKGPGPDLPYHLVMFHVKHAPRVKGHTAGGRAGPERTREGPFNLDDGPPAGGAVSREE